MPDGKFKKHPALRCHIIERGLMYCKIVKKKYALHSWGVWNQNYKKRNAHFYYTKLYWWKNNYELD